MGGLAFEALEVLTELGEAAGEELAGRKRHIFGGSTAIRMIEWVPDYFSAFAGTLTVTFARNGAFYDYDNVPGFVFDNWVEASSAGQYYNAEVKGVYG
jgi:hypothetical protein